MSNDTRGTEPDTTPESIDAAETDPAKAADADAAKDADAADALGEKDAEKAETNADVDGGDSDIDDYTVRRSPALIATAVALPVALIVGILVMGVLANRHHSRDPLALGAVPAPTAAGPQCSALMPALPDKIGDYTTSELVAPAPPATHAWQLPDGGDAIVVRCGLDRPMEFTKASTMQVIQTDKAVNGDKGVNWFEVRDQTSGVTSGTYWAVDRGVYIALTMPDNAGPTPLQDVSAAIQKTIPQQPLDPNPIPN
ncbi:DUF3515 domain-containing protein [Nocardia aurantiaca]|uniref:DUF3515 family protein n=1 Tax=Nocardia aurantiaca TaxID=2675850 RepID=A0A6I3KUG6_9NOCA|nr:DUF3515 domain-containing protein [Nocardia aurantiaca]MTE13021.1 DUF3515 family protein [Nocardia aurantiaca]